MIVEVESARVDQWLWAVRMFKSRSAATEACRGGHVRVNDSSAKAASHVKAGDRVEANVHGRRRVLEVVEVIDKRVGAAKALECLVDLSPPAQTRPETAFARQPGAGRPTKRDRRDLERLRR
jgi:ribosome-associated heat shock protein Hsp15